MTPLHWAIEREHVDTVEVLLQRGADPHIVSKFDKTAFDIALDNNRHDIVQLLQSVSVPPPPLQSMTDTADQQAMEEATLAATQSLAIELAQVPNPIQQEEVQTSTISSTTTGQYQTGKTAMLTPMPNFEFLISFNVRCWLA